MTGTRMTQRILLVAACVAVTAAITWLGETRVIDGGMHALLTLLTIAGATLLGIVIATRDRPHSRDARRLVHTDAPGDP